jgi:RNA 3'-terminal phosphate cyclase (ATP)
MKGQLATIRAGGSESLLAPIHLDGTTLEGGGQLLRLALSLSSLTKLPIHVTDVRGNRSSGKTGKGGGLKSSHLAGAQWLANATSAETKGMEIKSKELLFRPSLQEEPSFWRVLHKDDTRSSHITMSTPGSIFHILQSILPFIVFSSGPVPNEPAPSPEITPIRLTIEGGTNVDCSLSYEYAEQVLFPILESKLGIGPITMKLQRRGWSKGRADVGSVVFDISPLKPGQVLPGFSFIERGKLVKVHVSILAPSFPARNEIKELVLSHLLKQYPEVEVTFPVDEDSKSPQRLYLLLVAETSNGYRLGRDWLFDQKIIPSKMTQIQKRLVSKVVGDLGQELAHGGCVDEFLQDQLVAFQVLAEGESVVTSGDVSLHTRTCEWVAKQMLGNIFKGTGTHGIGFRAGQRQWAHNSFSANNLPKTLQLDSEDK